MSRPRSQRAGAPATAAGRRSGRVLAAWAVAVGVTLSACETSPSGPATVLGTVTGSPDVGAVVLDIEWPGIQGFEGRGSTQVYSAPVEGVPNRHRVVLVAPSGGELTFGVLVDDLYLVGPVVTVEEATSMSNLPRPVSDLSVVLER